MTASPRKLWTWSKQSVRAFIAAASKQPNSLCVADGLDAALMHELPSLAQAICRFRIELMTDPRIEQRVLRLKFSPGGYTMEPGECVVVKIPVDREFLMNCLAIPDNDGVLQVDGIAKPKEEPSDEIPS